jgi:hypothetical protein
LQAFAASEADRETAKTDLREINEFAKERKYNVWLKPAHLAGTPAQGERQPVIESFDWRDIIGFMNGKRVRHLAIWTRVADSDTPEGQMLIGLRHFHGMGIPVDEKAGVEWLRKAAEQGFMEAEYQLGTCYAKGIGVDEADEEEANKWFAKAAEQIQKAADDGDVKAMVTDNVENYYQLAVRGNADHVRELTQNATQHRVRVRFTNLQDRNLMNTGVFVDIQRMEIINRLQEAVEFDSITLEELRAR